MLVSRSTLSMVAIALVAMVAVAMWQPVDQSVAEETSSKTITSNNETIEDEETTDRDQQTSKNEKQSDTQTIYVKFPEDVQPEDYPDIIKRLQANGYEATEVEKTPGDDVIYGIVITVPAKIKPCAVWESRVIRQGSEEQVIRFLRIIDRQSVVSPGRYAATPSASSSPTSRKQELVLKIRVAEKKIRIAEKEVELREAEFQRVRRLSDSGSVPAIEVQRRKIALDKAQLEMGWLQLQLEEIAKPTSAEKQDPTLRYDGKTFDEWRNLWRTELKTEKRTEAIHALAAFGRAGYGKEAVETIFDVAEQYDFRDLDNSTPEGKLENAILNVLTTTSTSHFSEKIWLPVLMERIEDKPSPRNMLARWLLSHLKTKDQSIAKRLDELTRHADPNIRNSALQGLCSSDPKRTNPLVVNAIRRAFDSDNVSEVRYALNLMFVAAPNAEFFGGGAMILPLKPIYIPEMFPSLFHQNESIRRLVRERLRDIQPKDASQPVEQLVAILKDQKQTEKHLAAIRAISVIGRHAATAKPMLKKLIQHENMKLAIAAEYATNLIRTRGKHPLRIKPSVVFLQRDVKIPSNLQPNEEGFQEQQLLKYQKLYNQERAKIFPK